MTLDRPAALTVLIRQGQKDRITAKDLRRVRKAMAVLALTEQEQREIEITLEFRSQSGELWEYLTGKKAGIDV